MKIYAATFLHAEDQKKVIREGKYLHRLYSFYFVRQAIKNFKKAIKESR